MFNVANPNDIIHGGRDEFYDIDECHVNDLASPLSRESCESVNSREISPEAMDDECERKMPSPSRDGHSTDEIGGEAVSRENKPQDQDESDEDVQISLDCCGLRGALSK